MEWLPIESAPKDGSNFIAYDGIDAVVIHWGDSQFRDGYGYIRYPLLCWMELPMPPMEYMK